MEVAAVPQWTRESTWRQGQVLPSVATDALGLQHPEDVENTCVVVISHDCDLANDNLAAEPDVEVIIGRKVPAAKGNFSHGKSPRTLHIELLHDGAGVVIELVATCKNTISKPALAAFVPDVSFTLEPQMLHVLRSWLSARYNRAAFPDEFVTRMDDSKCSEKLAKLLEKYGHTISTIFFDVDDGQEINRSDGSPFQLSIVLAFVLGDDPGNAMDIADEAVEKVEQLFSSRLYDEKTEQWNGVALKSCVSISEDDLRVSQAKQFMQWRLEHMSLRGEESQAVPINL